MKVPCAATHWIGVYDTHYGNNFTNIDNSTATFFRWNSGYPFCNLPISCTINMGWAYYAWVNAPCTQMQPFVCQYRPSGNPLNT